MKKLIIIIISLLSFSANAQKYTNTYINDATKVALNWIKDVNSKEFNNAFNLLSKEVKERYQKETWIALMSDLMLEFGEIQDRTIIKKEFQSELEGLEDGFYVFIEYQSVYKNTTDHIEYILLKQNDKLQWQILDYNYEFKNKE